MPCPTSLLIRFLPDLSISTLLNCYFWLLGSFAGAGALGPVGGALLPLRTYPV